MSKIDHTLVFLQSENARMRLKEISQHLRKSPQLLKYSIRVLEKEGILKDPYTIFDYSYFGLLLFRVYFKGVYISEQDKERIIRKLRDNPYIIAIYEMTGEYDLVLEMSAPNPSRFNKELKKLSGIVPTLTNYKIVLNIVTHIYQRQYLLKGSQMMALRGEIIVGGDRRHMDFTQTELEVMKNLMMSPKLRLTMLAKRSGVNVKTSNVVLKNLEKAKVIKGFKHIVDTSMLDVERFRLFLDLHDMSSEREKDLLEFFKKTKDIVQVHKTVGDWSIEVDIEAFDRKKIRQVIMQMREEFKDIISNFNLIEFYLAHKRAFLPMFIFENEPKPEPQKKAAIGSAAVSLSSLS